MPAINDRIDLSDTEQTIFNALLQANKQVGAVGFDHDMPLAHGLACVAYDTM